MFLDRATLQVKAGKGGDGIVAWYRARYIPKGGPTGGNGGRGGDVLVVADRQLNSLDWFRNRRLLYAQNGGAGGPNNRRGRDGKNLLLKVPCGTLVRDVETGELLADLVEEGERLLLCSGGRGGRGNASFKSPTHRAPAICTEGKPGEIKTIELELKLIADIGLVGFPNAGKSTLINALTNVKAKAAAYPFTTLKPHLGYLELPDFTRLYLADIPGIIEGAHANRGLGLEFLRHIERTKALVFVLDASGIDGRTPQADLAVLQREIAAYNPELLERPSLVLLNKADTEEAEGHIEAFKSAFPLVENLCIVSALTGFGMEDFLVRLKSLLGSPHLP